MLALSLVNKKLETILEEPLYTRELLEPSTEILFIVPEDWTEIDKRVVFVREEETFRLQVIGDRTLIPNSILLEPGTFKVGLFGIKEETLFPIRWSDPIEVLSREEGSNGI